MHALEEKNGQYSFAFTGDRNNIWHRLGQELPQDASKTEWIKAAGFDYQVGKVMALAQFSNHTAETDMRFIVRQDTNGVLGFASKKYEIVQPDEIWSWFADYITVDERFHIDAAGVLHSGEKLWMTARFNGDVSIAGDTHVARLLMSTSYDSSQPTINQATMTRVVCQNTMRMAHADRRAAIKTRHSTKFNGQVVARELTQIAQSFADYKAMGDAMAQVELTAKQVSDFFKNLLDIPLEAFKENTSTRKLNTFDALCQAAGVTRRERNTSRNDVWTALQAVTRYVDHDRGVRNADNEEVGRFDSATWGSGDEFKGKAMALLMPMI